MPKAATPKLQHLSPSLIDTDTTQLRQEFDEALMTDLIANICEQGIVTPLRVAPATQGRYQLLYGERRLRAALAIGLATVPCLIEPKALGWMEALDIQITENLHRIELRPLEVAQTLWRRILGANIEALEAEQGESGAATAELLRSYLTPASQITALQDRLCALASVESVAAYLQSSQVRVSQKEVLARYGMAHYPPARLKKLFQTLGVAPDVQDMLAGIDVSARTLRDLKQHDPNAQAALVEAAKEQAGEGGAVGNHLRKLLDQEKKHNPSTALPDDAELEVEEDEPASVELLPAERGGKEFVPDPQLALLTKGNTAPKLVTDQVAPQRGSTPPTAKVGEWDDDLVLQLEAALEAARSLCTDAGALHLSERLMPQWSALTEMLLHAGLEA